MFKNFHKLVFSLAKAQQQQGCTECPTGCKNGTYLLRNRDQTCNCVCAEDLCNGIVCPPDFTCSQSKQCVPNKQGACPVQELTYLPKSTCLKDIDCKADLKCCPFNNNTYCSSKSLFILNKFFFLKNICVISIRTLSGNDVQMYGRIHCWIRFKWKRLPCMQMHSPESSIK